MLFKPLYTIPSTKREYGLVAVPPGGGPQFPERAVSEGTVRLRDDAGRKDESDEAARLLERLGVAEARAKADEKGVWAEAGGKVDCSYEVQDAKALLEANKGKVLDGACSVVARGIADGCSYGREGPHWRSADRPADDVTDVPRSNPCF